MKNLLIRNLGLFSRCLISSVFILICVDGANSMEAKSTQNILSNPRVNPPIPPSIGSYASKNYRNLFSEAGYSPIAVQQKIDSAWQQLFYGDSVTQRVYYPAGSDMAYIKDVGNNDVRSEGISYGMMICVQMNKKAEFDRLWKWAKTYLWHSKGDLQGYFAWQAYTSGQLIDQGSASDGEEYFITALFFASHRWGNGTGIFNYRAEALALLHEMLHHEEHVGQYSGIRNMFNSVEKKVVFSPNNASALYTDPSYHLPAFYELWALWGEKDLEFWKAAADTSRAFFKRTVNPTTYLGPDYAEFSGVPNNTGGHGEFRFDAWRIIQNISVDYAWWAKDPWQIQYANGLQQFFEKEGITTYSNQYTLSGQSLSKDHSPGMVAMNAVGTLSATDMRGWKFVDELWNLPIPSEKWRYYDGMLYMMGLLYVSGNFKIITPNWVDNVNIINSRKSKSSTNFYSSQLRKMGIVTFKNKDGAFSAKGSKIPLSNP